MTPGSLVDAIEDLMASLTKQKEELATITDTQSLLIIDQAALSELGEKTKTHYSRISTGDYYYKFESFTDISQTLLDFRSETTSLATSLGPDNSQEYGSMFFDKFSNCYKAEELHGDDLREWFFGFLFVFMSSPLPLRVPKQKHPMSSFQRDSNNSFCMFIVDVFSTAISGERTGQLSSEALYLIQFVRQSSYLSLVLINRLNLSGKPLKGFMLSQNFLNSTSGYNLSVP